MTVGELKRLLEQYPDDAIVAIYSDEVIPQGTEHLQVLDVEHVELEVDPSNTGGLPAPAVMITLDPNASLL